MQCTLAETCQCIGPVRGHAVMLIGQDLDLGLNRNAGGDEHEAVHYHESNDRKFRCSYLTSVSSDIEIKVIPERRATERFPPERHRFPRLIEVSRPEWFRFRDSIDSELTAGFLQPDSQSVSDD